MTAGDASTDAVVALLQVVRGAPPMAFSLARREHTIGRAAECDIVLPDPSVSRCHARLVPDGDGFRVEDLGSRHGTVVGDVRVERAALTAGAVLRLGNVMLLFLRAEPEAATADLLDRPAAEDGIAGISTEVLDGIQLAVVLVGRGGEQVLWANRSARAILERSDGLRAGSYGLRVADASAARQLRRLLSQRANEEGGGAMHVPRASGRPLALLATPLVRGASSAGPLYALFITDPDAELETPVATLSRLYGLTVTESEVAGELLAGRTPEELASQLGISIHTARTHVKRILAKTGTRRQSELLRLLLLGPAQLRSQP
jgi:DNA-binding CsgD family transcriptional regulator/pSer/pThr/pTyr-binding forkhead associated (FHA) protein